MAPGCGLAETAFGGDLARALYRRTGAERWGLSEDDFRAALDRSLAHRFKEQLPSRRELEQYLDSLHLDHLALACACARGSERAWQHFVTEFRPMLRAAAASCAPPDRARELADGMYADLFGLAERDGVRRSLFDYFHGRSALGSWLRAVIAQRAVDAARAARRVEPLPEEDDQRVWVREPVQADIDRPRRLALVRRALARSIAALVPRDRLRLSLYYARQLRLAAVGRILNESEATVSRKLERTRSDLRRAIEHQLRQEHGLGDAQIAACFEDAQTDPAFDLARVLPESDAPNP